jgi:hypothetical protein
VKALVDTFPASRTGGCPRYTATCHTHRRAVRTGTNPEARSPSSIRATSWTNARNRTRLSARQAFSNHTATRDIAPRMPSDAGRTNPYTVPAARMEASRSRSASG